MLYIPKYFEVHELVDPETYNDFWEKYGTDNFENELWKLFTPQLLITLEEIKEFTKFLTGEYQIVKVNNWWWGGNYKWSGLRNNNSKHFKRSSQHSYIEGLKLCNAADLKIENIKPKDLQKEIIKNHKKFSYLTRIEKGTPTWTHIDCKLTVINGIYQFDPKKEI